MFKDEITGGKENRKRYHELVMVMQPSGNLQETDGAASGLLPNAGSNQICRKKGTGPDAVSVRKTERYDIKRTEKYAPGRTDV